MKFMYLHRSHSKSENYERRNGGQFEEAGRRVRALRLSWRLAFWFKHTRIRNENAAAFSPVAYPFHIKQE